MSSSAILPEMTSLITSSYKINKAHPYPQRNNPVKFHQDRIRFSRVIVLTSPERNFTRNDVTDDVIIKKIIEFILTLPTKKQSCEVSSRSDKI